MAGKTGTAQVISNQGRDRARGSGTSRDLRDHGWFVFFAPRDHPQIAGAIFAEHSEHGYLAAPIARHVIDTYFAKLEGRPLPDYPVPKAAPAGPLPADPDVVAIVDPTDRGTGEAARPAVRRGAAARE